MNCINKHFTLKSGLLLLCFIFTINLCAQKKVNSNSSYDTKFQPSLRKKGKAIDLTRFYLDSAQYLTDKSPLRAIEFVNKAIERSLKENNTSNESYAFLILGNIHFQLEQYDLAAGNYQKSIDAGSIRQEYTSNQSQDFANPALFNAYKNLPDKLLSKLNEKSLQFKHELSA